jgi:hypothetical protein
MKRHSIYRMHCQCRKRIQQIVIHERHLIAVEDPGRQYKSI